MRYCDSTFSYIEFMGTLCVYRVANDVDARLFCDMKTGTVKTRFLNFINYFPINELKVNTLHFRWLPAHVAVLQLLSTRLHIFTIWNSDHFMDRKMEMRVYIVYTHIQQLRERFALLERRENINTLVVCVCVECLVE